MCLDVMHSCESVMCSDLIYLEKTLGYATMLLMSKDLQCIEIFEKGFGYEFSNECVNMCLTKYLQALTLQFESSKTAQCQSMKVLDKLNFVSRMVCH